ncbi:MAG: CPBP family intramembrane metalloprotease [Gemmatimonadota bacterium]|nr:MAG: CPBP family intramembrane metalloprotease [Gemmatimonadota bacterium]
MRAADLFYGPEKLRALWRLLLFLACAALVLAVIGTITSPIVPEEYGGLWAIVVPHGLYGLALLVASLVMMRGLERKRFAALGFPLGRDTLADLLKGAAIGGGFVAGLVVVQTLLGWLSPVPDAGTVPGWLLEVVSLALALTVVAAAEELAVRGYAFQVLVEGAGVVLAIALTSGLFALIHLNNPGVNWVALLNVVLAGVLFAAAYLRTRSLWVPIGMHWGWNFVMAAFFDLPVSGIAFDVPGYDTVRLGPDLLTGGAFGPEASLLTTLFLLPLIVWVFRTPWLSESRQMAELGPLVDSRLAPQQPSV